MAWGQHSVLLNFSGNIKVAGLNNYGQLGLGHTISPQKDIQNVSLGNVIQISKGGNFTMFLLKDKTVRGVGHNTNGQLGIGNGVNQTAIQTIPITGVKQVVCGQNYTMFLMENGTVKAVGLNSLGQLGLGFTNSHQSVIQTVPITGVKQISCGAHHTLFLLGNGEARSVGRNHLGQLANQNMTTQNVIQSVPLWGVKQVAAGYAFSMFLMNDGTVKAIGENAQGQLGLGDTTNRSTLQTVPITGVDEIYVSGSTAFFRMMDGTLKGCGHNYMGLLGVGDTVNKSTIQDIDIQNVKEVSVDGESTMFLMNDGTVKVAGRNYEGQLGNSQLSSTVLTISNSLFSDIGSLEKVLSALIKKWLIRAEGKIKKFENGSWVDVGDAPATKNMFLNSGLNSLNGLPLGKLKEIQKPEILLWNPEKGKTSMLSVNGIPQAKLVKGLVDISISNVTKLRLVSSTTGIIKIILSNDGGASWKGKRVVNVSDINDVKEQGFTVADFNALSKEQIEELTLNRKVRFAYYFEQVSQADVASISALYVNEVKYSGTSSIGKLDILQTLKEKDEVIIECKNSSGVWREIKLDEIIKAKSGEEWTSLELRVRMKGDQQLNAIAFSWS